MPKHPPCASTEGVLKGVTCHKKGITARGRVCRQIGYPADPYSLAGNTCYMGAMLSALAALHPFVNDLLDPRFVAQMDGQLPRGKGWRTSEDLAPIKIRDCDVLIFEKFPRFQSSLRPQLYLRFISFLFCILRFPVRHIPHHSTETRV